MYTLDDVFDFRNPKNHLRWSQIKSNVVDLDQIDYAESDELVHFIQFWGHGDLKIKPESYQ